MPYYMKRFHTIQWATDKKANKKFTTLCERIESELYRFRVQLENAILFHEQSFEDHDRAK